MYQASVKNRQTAAFKKTVFHISVFLMKNLIHHKAQAHILNNLALLPHRFKTSWLQIITFYTLLIFSVYPK